MVIELPNRLDNNFTSYKSLINLFNDNRDFLLEDISIDFSRTTWFSANLCAILGAIIFQLQENLNNIEFINVSDEVKKILTKNKFLSNFNNNLSDHADNSATTIKYRKFKRDATDLFNMYLKRNLFSKHNSNLPEMSDPLKKEIRKSILEVFTNAQHHSNCTHIFSCGQLFPKKNRLDFTIVDIGKTIQKNVCDFLKKPTMDALEAIEWSVIKEHTTRVGPIPGGLGLSGLLEFLSKNKGKAQIISGNAYWTSNNDYKLFPTPFEGTIVNLEFNTDDKKSYRLPSES